MTIKVRCFLLQQSRHHTDNVKLISHDSATFNISLCENITIKINYVKYQYKGSFWPIKLQMFLELPVGFHIRVN